MPPAVNRNPVFSTVDASHKQFKKLVYNGREYFLLSLYFIFLFRQAEYMRES